MNSPASGSPGRAAVVLVSVHRTGQRALTSEVESLLKCNPVREFTLRDVLRCLASSAEAAKVNSVLYKLVHSKKRVRLGRAHNGVREVNTYRWRMPGMGA